MYASGFHHGTAARDITRDPLRPVITSSALASNGFSLSVTCNRLVVAGGLGFSLTASGGAVTLTYAGGSGTSVIAFTTSRLIYSTETLTLAYADGDCINSTFDELANISGVAVTNNSSFAASDTDPPEIAGTPVLAANGRTLSISFDEDITGTTGFTLSASGGAVSLAIATQAAQTLTYTASRDITSAETLTLAYAGASGNILDLSSNELANFSGVSVTNNSSVTGSEPTVTSWSVGTNGTTVTINFSTSMTGTKGFWLNVASLEYSSGSGTATHTYTANSTIYSDSNSPVLNYRKYRTSYLTSGSSDLMEFANKTGTNNSTQTFTGVNIDSDWLTANGPSPYYLLTASTTYRLKTNVTTEGTAFMILNANVVFDLNGYTITYSNSSYVSVANGGFESELVDGAIPDWTFSDPSKASRVTVRNGMWGNWMLRISGYSTPQTFTTSGSISIPLANVSYSVSVTPKSGSGVTVSIAVLDAGTSAVIVTSNSSNPGRGYAAVATWIPTTTDPVKIRVTVSGGSSCDFDRVTFERSQDMGVSVAKSSTGLSTHLRTATVNANLGKVSSPTVRNGAITAGAAYSLASNPVRGYSTPGVTIDNLTLTANGADSMHYGSQYDSNLTVMHCRMGGDLASITNRMANNAMVKNSAGSGTITVRDNYFSGHAQMGVSVSSTGDMSIAWNVMEHYALCTNSYGIHMGHNSSTTTADVSNNWIKPLNGRGILLDGSGSTVIRYTNIHDNWIEAREVANLEYTADAIEATALRWRNYSVTHDHVNITDNTFIAETGIGKSWACIGARISFDNSTGQMNNTANVLSGNTFRAIALEIDPDHTGIRPTTAWGMSIATFYSGTGTTFADNTFESNHVALNLGDNDGSGVTGLRCSENTFVKSSSGASMTFDSVRVGDFSKAVTDTWLINNAYSGGASSTIAFLGSTVKDISTGWLLDVTVTDAGVPVVGATVTVTTAQSTQIFSGTTNASGQCVDVPCITTTFSGTTSSSSTNHNNLAVAATKDSKNGSNSVNLTAAASTTVAIA